MRLSVPLWACLALFGTAAACASDGDRSRKAADGASPASRATPAKSRSSQADPPARWFAPDSIWNRQLPNDAPLDPSSSQRTAALVREVEAEQREGRGPGLNDTKYSAPVWRVPADQPTVRVKMDVGSWGADLQRAFERVPIPPQASQAAGTDGAMAVYQPSTDTMWEMWRAKRTSSGWQARWGGAISSVRSSPGYYSSEAWPGLTPAQGWNWGTTASSLPFMAGIITADELRRGRIDHALAMSIPDTCRDFFAWPAQRTDGTATNGDCLPEGAHLRLDPRLDVSKLKVPWMTRMLAEAAQRYGVVIKDKTWSSVVFAAEDPQTLGGNPYSGPTGLYRGARKWEFVPPFPWKHLQLLDMQPCTKRPCRRAG